MGGLCRRRCAFSFAVTSFYFAAGGTAGVSTLGGKIEELARARDPGLSGGGPVRGRRTLYADGVVGLVLLGLWLFAIFDVISTDSSMCRNLPKSVWLIVVIILPEVGSIPWLLLGRPELGGFRPGDTTMPTSRRPVGPEDAPAFQSRSEELSRRLEEWDADQERRRADLSTKNLGA